MDPLSAVRRSMPSRRMRVVLVLAVAAIAAVASHRFHAGAIKPVAPIAADAAIDAAERAHLDELEQTMGELAKQPPRAISPEGLRAVAERWTTAQTGATRPFEPQRVDGTTATARDRNAAPRVPRTREEKLLFAADIRPFLVSP